MNDMRIVYGMNECSYMEFYEVPEKIGAHIRSVYANDWGIWRSDSCEGEYNDNALYNSIEFFPDNSFISFDEFCKGCSFCKRGESEYLSGSFVIWRSFGVRENDTLNFWRKSCKEAGHCSIDVCPYLRDYCNYVGDSFKELKK